MNARTDPPVPHVRLDAPLPPDDEIGLLEIVQVLREYWKSLVLVPLATGTAALAFSFAMTPIYTGTARILPPQQQSGGAMALLSQQLGSLAGIAGAAAGIKSPGDQFVSMLRSRTIADKLIERFELRALYEADFAEDARRSLASNSTITVGSKDGVITIEVDDESPQRAAAIANAYVEELETMLQSLALTESAQRRAFFAQQLEAARRELAAAEESLRRSGVSESVLRAEPRATLEEVARLKAALTAAEIRVASMKGYLSDAHPDMRQAVQEIAVLRGRLASADRNGGSRQDGEGSDYVARYRAFKYTETLYELMAKQYEIARIDEARDAVSVQMIDVAVPAEKKSKPRKALIAAITATGTFIVMVFVVAMRRGMRRRLGA